MRKIVLLAIEVLFISVGFAQTERGKITATIINEQQAALENATVELLRSKDSSLVKAAITDAAGIAEFDNIPFNTYLLRISMVNYTKQLSSSFTLSDGNPSLKIPTITLQPKSPSAMKEVTITAQKPFIQKLTDRIVVNVDNSLVNAGS